MVARVVRTPHRLDPLGGSRLTPRALLREATRDHHERVEAALGTSLPLTADRYCRMLAVLLLLM